MPCHIIGDSIAVGVSTFLPECHRRAKEGLSGRQFITMFGCGAASMTVVSLGNNPDISDPTDSEIMRLRRCLEGRVIWLMPPARHRELIYRLAAEAGDQVIDVREGGGTLEQIHPTREGYKLLASRVREAMQR